MNPILTLAAAIDSRLHDFAAIDLREDSGGCCDSLSARPWFPKLYLSGKKDKALMSLPGEGTALIGYKVQRRTIDESNDDGPRYGADIEVRSIEPYAEEPADDEEDEPAAELMAALEGVREFGFKPRTATQLLKTSKRNPLKLGKTSAPGEFKVYPKGRPYSGTAYYTDDLKDARDTAAAMLKTNRKRVRDGVPGFFAAGGDGLHHFAGERDRDPEGRFSNGQVARPDDFMLAHQAKPKASLAKKAALAGAGALGVGALALKRDKILSQVGKYFPARAMT